MSSKATSYQKRRGRDNDVAENVIKGIALHLFKETDDCEGDIRRNKYIPVHAVQNHKNFIESRHHNKEKSREECSHNFQPEA
ncbi:MAG: hypothetical protein J4428_03740 [Candidatus Aenigmarchaeota archaeon]|nr:hypothetical protein [Candidatus Aenigmarchaeota archaeon]